MDKKYSIIIESYNLKLRNSGAKKIVSEFSNMLNKTVGYGDKQITWGSSLLLKTRKLAHYLVGKTKNRFC